MINNKEFVCECCYAKYVEIYTNTEVLLPMIDVVDPGESIHNVCTDCYLELTGEIPAKHSVPSYAQVMH